MEAQFSEILESGRASPASFQRLGGKLPFAQIYIMGKIARAALRPSYLQSNSDVASRTPFPLARTAPEWRFQALSCIGPRVVHPVSPPRIWPSTQRRKALGVARHWFFRFRVNVRGPLF